VRDPSIGTVLCQSNVRAVRQIQARQLSQRVTVVRTSIDDGFISPVASGFVFRRLTPRVLRFGPGGIRQGRIRRVPSRSQDPGTSRLSRHRFRVYIDAHVTITTSPFSRPPRDDPMTKPDELSKGDDVYAASTAPCAHC
jgi:hypothetical protein